jgi:hypothetical protein
LPLPQEQVPLKLPFSKYIKAHHISHAALSVGAVVAAIVFFVVGAGVRLLMGPVSLGPLQQTLAGAIQTALPGISLQYDKAAIEWDREQDRVNLVVLGTRILDQDGKVVATAPKADIDLAAAPFLAGRVAVRRITLVGVSLRLVHMKNGGVRLGAEGDKTNDIYERLNDVIQAKGSSSSSLKSFAVRNANLALFDEVTGLHLTAPRADLSITAQGKASIAVSFNADVNVLNGSGSGGKPAHVKADMLLPADTGPISGSATISHLDLAALGANAPLFQPLRSVPLSTNLSVKFNIAQGGHVSQTDFDLSADGEIPWAALKDKALHVRQLRLTGHYDGLKNHLALTQAALDAREAQLKLKGGAEFVYDSKGALDSIAADLSAARAALSLPGVLPAPVSLTAAQLRGVWHAGPRSLDVTKFSLGAPGFALDAKGDLQLGQPGQSPGLTMTGTMAPMPEATLMRYWPLTVAPSTRDWIVSNVYAGNVGQIAFETHFTPGMMDEAAWPDSSMKLSFPLSGVEGNYIRGLTHLTGVTGSAILTGDTFTADFTTGRVGTLAVSKGHALIPTLHVDGTVGEFSAHVDGPLPDVMTLIDMKPLGYPTRFGVDPKQTAGTAGVDITVKVPMLAKLKVDDVGILVNAAVSDFGVTLGRLRLSKGEVNFTIDNNTLHQVGAVNLADSRLSVDWVEDFKTNDDITTKLNVKGQITDAGRAALNIGLASILTGPVGVNGTLEGHRGSLRTADMQLDLTPSTVMVPIVHLGKPAGQAATGHVTVNFGAGDNIADETIRITGPALAAVGSANFDKNGVLTVLNFPTLKMGTLNDLSFVLTKNAQVNGQGGGDAYVIRGHSMDGSLVGRNANANASPSSNPGVNASAPAPDETPRGPFQIDAKLDRLAMRDGVSFAPFSMQLSGSGNRPGTLALAGTLTQTGVKATQPITAQIEAVPTGRKLILSAGDAGMLIRGMFAFESLRGGKLTLLANLPGKAGDPEVTGAAPDYTGKLDIDKFTMVNQPFLSRLFSAASITGMADLLGGSGISVDNLDVPFSSKNNVISVTNARAVGAIGISADGYIDRPKNQVALKGSMIPAYGLNSILSNVPLLGDLLASKKGEGIIGITYSATGNADQPSIDVNPLSALTPGILRRIFEGHMPTAANAPSNAPSTPVVPPTPVTSAPPSQQAATPVPAPRPEQ